MLILENGNHLLISKNGNHLLIFLGGRKVGTLGDAFIVHCLCDAIWSKWSACQRLLRPLNIVQAEKMFYYFNK